MPALGRQNGHGDAPFFPNGWIIRGIGSRAGHAGMRIAGYVWSVTLRPSAALAAFRRWRVLAGSAYETLPQGCRGRKATSLTHARNAKCLRMRESIAQGEMPLDCWHVR